MSAACLGGFLQKALSPGGVSGDALAVETAVTHQFFGIILLFSYELFHHLNSSPIVRPSAAAPEIALCQIPFGVLVSALKGLLKAAESLIIIYFGAPAVVITASGIVAAVLIPCFCRRFEKLQCLCIVLGRPSVAIKIHQTQVDCTDADAILNPPFTPAYGIGVAL